MLLNSYLPCITPAQYVGSTTKVKEPQFFKYFTYLINETLPFVV